MLGMFNRILSVSREYTNFLASTQSKHLVQLPLLFSAGIGYLRGVGFLEFISSRDYTGSSRAREAPVPFRRTPL